MNKNFHVVDLRPLYSTIFGKESQDSSKWLLIDKQYIYNIFRQPNPIYGECFILSFVQAKYVKGDSCSIYIYQAAKQIGLSYEEIEQNVKEISSDYNHPFYLAFHEIMASAIMEFISQGNDIKFLTHILECKPYYLIELTETV